MFPFFPATLDDLKEITEEEEEEEGERKRAEDEGVRWDLFLRLAFALLLLFSDTPAGATLVFFSSGGPAPLALAMAFFLSFLTSPRTKTYSIAMVWGVVGSGTVMASSR